MEEKVRNEIKKASAKHDRLEVTYNENFNEDNYSNEVSKKCSQIIHSDMKAAFEKLKPHLVLVCEQPEATAISSVGIYDFDITKLENYVITGYSVGGSDESAGVTIIGQKLLKSGVLNISTPFIKYEDEEGYEFSGELYADVQACNAEVLEYLFNNKWGLKQQEFDFDLEEQESTKVPEEA